jgi:hypothetical protein
VAQPFERFVNIHIYIILTKMKRHPVSTDNDSSEDDDASGSSDDDWSQASDSASSFDDDSSDDATLESDADDDDSDNADTLESDADDDDSDIANTWAANAYAPSTQGEFARLYRRFLKWIAALRQEVQTACEVVDGKPEKPFCRYLSASLFFMICTVHIDCRKLCVLYMNSESKRLTSWNGGISGSRRLGGGTLTNV